MLKQIKKSVITFMVIAAIASNGLSSLAVQSETDNHTSKTSASTGVSADEYYSYYEAYSGRNRVTNRVEINGGEITASQNGEKSMATYAQISGAYIGDENNWCDWKFTIVETGVYCLKLGYYPIAGSGRDIEISVSIDGQVPYKEFEDISLPRIWSDKIQPDGSVIKRDAYGNDLCPEQVETPHWTEEWAGDSNGLYDEPYLLYLTAGEHTVRIADNQESVAFNKIQFAAPEQPEDYQSYYSTVGNHETVNGETVVLQAENAFEKSSSSLYPSYDRSNVATTPNSSGNIRLNKIGGSNWSRQGQFITWKVNVPRDGLYRIAFRARQNSNPGLNSYRTLYINGKIPFREAENIEFKYDADWYVKKMGDESTLVYLKQGDTITLEATAGIMYNSLRNLNQTVLSMDELYRNIIIVTGTDPDIYRDYSLNKQIPDLEESLAKIKSQLLLISNEIKGSTGKSSSQASTMDEMISMLDSFIANPYTITERLGKFKSDIDGVASLLLSLNQQPLELDCLYFVPVDAEIPNANATWSKNLSFNISKFINSFINDYNDLGDSKENGDSVSVWITTGRDQAQILNDMISDSFTNETGIPIKLSLVDTGQTLIQATLAGKGPDVALMVPNDMPVNLAMRGALVDLSSYGIDESYYNQFYPSAWTPYYYNSGLYALPETQIYNMLFYRTDIFGQLGITPPETWTDFYAVLQTIQNNNMEVGLLEIDKNNPGVSAGISIFDSLLFQRGGTYFNSSLSKTEFDTSTAYEAFDEWVKLYTTYGLDRDFDFYNRFRTGEMPLGIAAYTTYNMLMAAAPEIKGLWSIASIPGTVRSDGTIDKSESSSGTGCIMMKSAVERNVDAKAFQFMTWWTSAETQKNYGKKLESVLGVSARYTPANTVAFNGLDWTKGEISLLNGQWNCVKNVNQIPGNYMIVRDLTNAFRDCVINNANTRNSLTLYNKDINDEIQRKRKEFNLN